MRDDNSKEQQMLGRSVMNALRDHRYKATISDLCRHIANINKTSYQLIRPTVESVLNRGIRNGFLIRSEKHYLLPSLFQTDGDEDDDNEDEDLKSVLALCDKALEDIRLAKQDGSHLSEAECSINEVKRAVGTYMTNDSLDKWAKDLDNEGALSRRDKENLAACKKLEDDLKRKRAKLAHVPEDENVGEELPTAQTSSSRKRKVTVLSKSPSPGCLPSTSRASPSKRKRT